MGLALNSTRFLACARRDGIRFDDTLTLGRQHMLVGPRRIEKILKEAGLWPPPEGVEAFRQSLRTHPWRFEVFARALGARTVTACDASAYEGAGLVHDLNTPISEKDEACFDVVIDGGTLEHVFNFPVAIANCMKLVKPGGHLILLTPANNYFGHGFYQFSPELFFRVLSPENGFEVLKMISLEDGLGKASLFGVHYDYPIDGPWFEVHDPARIGRRVTLLNRNATALYVLAKKTAAQPLFKTPPQQSDYVPQWQRNRADPIVQSAWSARVVNWLRGKFDEDFCREGLPALAGLLNPFRSWRFRRDHSYRNPVFFTPTEPMQPVVPADRKRSR